MAESVYIETTIISYLAARPSMNVVVLAHQMLTERWWEDERDRYDLYTSELVLDEIQRGDAEARERRLSFVDSLTVLEISDSAIELANLLVREGAVPEKAGDDALHLAIATLHRMDFLVTWNCRHLANVHAQKRARKVLEGAGHNLPTICTPEELMGEPL